MNNINNIGDKILYQRKKMGFSQEELAEKLCVSRQAVSRWENGESVPDIEKIVLLSRLFNVSSDYLLFDECNEDVYKGMSENNKDNVTFRKLICSLVFLISGSIILSVSFILAGNWAKDTYEYYTNLGPFLTGLLTTGILLPFILGVIMFSLGVMFFIKYYLEK